MTTHRTTTLAIACAFLLLSTYADAATVKIEWDPPRDGVTSGYIIWGGISPGRYLHAVDVGLVTSYEVTGLAEGVTYYFAVQAYNSNGALSPLSEEVSTTASGTAPCTVMPGAPVLLARASGHVAHLSWTPGPGGAPTRYVLEVGSTPGARNIAVVHFGPETTQLTAPAPAGTYVLRLIAVNDCGSRQSAEVTVTVGTSAPTVPGPPLNLRHEISEQLVRLRWSAPAGAHEVTRYIIEVSDAQDRLLVRIDHPDVGRTFAQGNAPEGVYVVRIRAVNGAGVGEASNAVTVRIKR